MEKYRYIFGPIPSRRLGNSLGISPIPRKYCNYSCVYCQLGPTKNLSIKRQEYIDIKEIIQEFKKYLGENLPFDIVSIVGEGEPTLNSNLESLIKQLKELTEKPIAVITNGSLLMDKNVRKQLLAADIIMPSLDAYNQESFVKINRPHKQIKFEEVYSGLKDFSQEFSGKIWLEIMIVKNINDSEDAIYQMKNLLQEIRYDRLFINTPVRPPAEKWVEVPDNDRLQLINDVLAGISIENTAKGQFHSNFSDDLEGVLSIIKRHPMKKEEIEDFLKSRGTKNKEEVLTRLAHNEMIEIVDYKGYSTYRFK